MRDLLLVLALHLAGPALGAGSLVWRGEAHRAEHVWSVETPPVSGIQVQMVALFSTLMYLFIAGMIISAAIALLWRRRRQGSS